MDPVLFNVFVVLYNNHLVTGPSRNQLILFPGILMFPSTLSEETLSFSGNKINCFPEDRS